MKSENKQNYSVMKGIRIVVATAESGELTGKSIEELEGRPERQITPRSRCLTQ